MVMVLARVKNPMALGSSKIKNTKYLELQTITVPKAETEKQSCPLLVGQFTLHPLHPLRVFSLHPQGRASGESI